MTWLLLGLVLVASALLRARLLEFPLERDEGEYAYAGQLILQGIPPYKIAYNMKLPGTYAMYALIMAVFGQTTVGIHTGLIVLNSITIILLFLVTRRLVDSTAGIVAAAAYGFLSMAPTFMAFAAHATHFINVFAVAGTLLLLRAADSGRYLTFLASGVLFGLAFLMKQHAFALVIFGCLASLALDWNTSPFPWWRSLRRGAAFALGAAIPFALCCGILAWHGVLERFWFWTFAYARQYVQRLSFYEGSRMFRETFIGQVVYFTIQPWLWSALGLFAIWQRPTERGSARFVSAWLFFSFLATCPGLFFRTHYFIVMIPAVSLLIGRGFNFVHDLCLSLKFSSRAALGVSVLVFALTNIPWGPVRVILFEMSPFESCDFVYRGNPFVESMEISNFIQKHTAPDDLIAILGSEPQIYFYSKRHSATGYIYTYPLVENQPFALDMQKEMANEIEEKSPKIIVEALLRHSWMDTRKSQRYIFNWAENFLKKNYDLVGSIQMIDGQAIYKWGKEAKHPGGASGFILIYQRKGT